MEAGRWGGVSVLTCGHHVEVTAAHARRRRRIGGPTDEQGGGSDWNAAVLWATASRLGAGRGAGSGTTQIK